MNVVSGFWTYPFLLTAVLLIGLGKLPAFADDTVQEGNVKAVQVGRVTVLGPVKCPTGATQGASCTSVSVTCPNIPALTAVLSEAIPTGTARGTIILNNGGGGTSFLNSGFANTYFNDGFRVVQLAWSTDWEDTGGVGLKRASCRGATLYRYLFYTVHHGDRTTGFCAQGSSGGGAAITYALSQYGLSSYFDYVVIAAGPGISRMDYACDSSLYTGPPLDLCPLLPNAPYAFTHGAKVNTWENTTTCAVTPALQSDIDKWMSDSIVTTGANFSYPQTAMSWYFCATPPVNNSTGGGKFLIDQVHPKTTPDVNCYSGVCQGESVWEDPTAFSDTHNSMLAQCVPNHQ